MIDERGCIEGRRISYSPQRGPEDIHRRSLQILESCTAAVFIVLLISANSPESCVASTRLPASVTGIPLISARCFVQSAAYPGGLLMPVPTAVAPMLIGRNSSPTCVRWRMPSPIITAYAENSCPSVIG